MAIFDPWAWRDPAILAGGYSGAAPDRGPSPDDPTDVETDDGGPGTEIDLTGYAVRATDGRIGSVVQVDRTPGAAYLVVDTGPWIFGHEVLLPAGVVERVDHQERTVYVDRTRDQVRHAPDAADHNAVGEYYRKGYNR
jgi:hypothetical protein